MKQYNLLVTIHPWVDGNGRMSRLVMNYLQFEFGLIPTKVLKEDKAAYIEALNQSREEETTAPFQQFMPQEHSRNLRNEIEVFKNSMAEDVVINERKVVQKGGPEHKEVVQKITLDYDTIGGLFGDMYLGVHELTVVEKIWAIIIEVVAIVSELIGADSDELTIQIIENDKRLAALREYAQTA